MSGLKEIDQNSLMGQVLLSQLKGGPLAWSQVPRYSGRAGIETYFWLILQSTLTLLSHDFVPLSYNFQSAVSPPISLSSP